MIPHLGHFLRIEKHFVEMGNCKTTVNAHLELFIMLDIEPRMRVILLVPAVKKRHPASSERRSERQGNTHIFKHAFLFRCDWKTQRREHRQISYGEKNPIAGYPARITWNTFGYPSCAFRSEVFVTWSEVILPTNCININRLLQGRSFLYPLSCLTPLLFGQYNFSLLPANSPFARSSCKVTLPFES